MDRTSRALRPMDVMRHEASRPWCVPALQGRGRQWGRNAAGAWGFEEVLPHSVTFGINFTGPVDIRKFPDNCPVEAIPPNDSSLQRDSVSPVRSARGWGLLARDSDPAVLWCRDVRPHSFSGNRRTVLQFVERPQDIILCILPPAKKKKSVFVYLSVLLAGVALPVYAYAQSTCEQCFSDCETVWIFTTQSCSTLPGDQRWICGMPLG